jgi:hypothetical protein
MKKIHFLLLIIVTVISIIVYSCKKQDPCEGVVCPAGKVCSSGTCTCPFGYEGANCDSLSAIKFVGNYQVNENCQNPPGPGFNYTTNISYGFRDFEVIISNILGSGLSVEASVDGNSIYIREQTVGNLRIVGEGFYQPVTGRIQINYEYNYSGSSRACTAFFQRF